MSPPPLKLLVFADEDLPKLTAILVLNRITFAPSLRGNRSLQFPMLLDPLPRLSIEPDFMHRHSAGEKSLVDNSPELINILRHQLTVQLKGQQKHETVKR